VEIKGSTHVPIVPILVLGGFAAFAVYQLRKRRRAIASSTSKAKGSTRLGQILGFAGDGTQTFAVFPAGDGQWDWSINTKQATGKEPDRDTAFATAMSYWLPNVLPDTHVEYILDDMEVVVVLHEGMYEWHVVDDHDKIVQSGTEQSRGAALIASLEYLKGTGR